MRKQCDEDGYIDDPDAHYNTNDNGDIVFFIGCCGVFLVIAIWIIAGHL